MTSPIEFSPEWFDECSLAWRANKKRIGESWIYVCKVNGCKRTLQGEEYCKLHSHTHSMTLRPRPDSKWYKDRYQLNVR